MLLHLFSMNTMMMMKMLMTSLTSMNESFMLMTMFHSFNIIVQVSDQGRDEAATKK